VKASLLVSVVETESAALNGEVEVWSTFICVVIVAGVLNITEIIHIVLIMSRQKLPKED